MITIGIIGQLFRDFVPGDGIPGWLGTILGGSFIVMWHPFEVMMGRAEFLSPFVTLVYIACVIGGGMIVWRGYRSPNGINQEGMASHGWKPLTWKNMALALASTWAIKFAIFIIGSLYSWEPMPDWGRENLKYRGWAFPWAMPPFFNGGGGNHASYCMIVALVSVAITGYVGYRIAFKKTGNAAFAKRVAIAFAAVYFAFTAAEYAMWISIDLVLVAFDLVLKIMSHLFGGDAPMNSGGGGGSSDYCHPIDMSKIQPQHYDRSGNPVP